MRDDPGCGHLLESALQVRGQRFVLGTGPELHFLFVFTGHRAPLVGRRRRVSAQPSFPRSDIHITPLCIQFASSRAAFYLTTEVGVVETPSERHSRLFRKSEFVFLFTTARILFFPPFSQPHRYSRKQDRSETLAEELEKQTSFSVIWPSEACPLLMFWSGTTAGWSESLLSDYMWLRSPAPERVLMPLLADGM